MGWSDTIGDVSLQEVFRMVDSGVSGILERLEIVPDLDQRYLEISGWKAISASLSRGVVAEIENESVRVIGLNKDGFLSVEVDDKEVLVSDAHEIKWRFPLI